MKTFLLVLSLPVPKPGGATPPPSRNEPLFARARLQPSKKRKKPCSLTPSFSLPPTSHQKKTAATSAAALFGLGGASATKEKTDTVYDYTVTGIDGNKIPLSKFKGKVLVIVNVASACG